MPAARDARARAAYAGSVLQACGTLRSCLLRIVFEARLEHAPGEIVELDSELVCGFRYERVARHAGRRVHLEEEILAVAIAHEVDATPAAATDRAERFERERAHFGLRRTAQSGTDVLRILGEILRVIVVILARRHDSDRR